MPYLLKTKSKKILGDTHTPVSLYMKLRDRFSNCILLESSDFHAHDNSYSYICFDPIASLSISANAYVMEFPDGTKTKEPMLGKQSFALAIKHFMQEFKIDESSEKGMINGLFGYTGFEAVQWMEQLNFDYRSQTVDYPLAEYKIYRYTIAFDHFKDSIIIQQNLLEDAHSDQIDTLLLLIENRNVPIYPFSLINEEKAEISSEDYLRMCEDAIKHCQYGDVFQLVLSRKFSQSFFGDDFNVYRSLRALNPSPYLFYFDFGNYRIFGSSPEAQLRVTNGKAFIHPIAGTFKRSGNDKADADAASRLLEDPKENAEHIMLVDLARNDLSRHCTNVKVEQFRQIQYFSHVIHLVSIVSGLIPYHDASVHILADSFPAGTLSGAPKIKALELIQKYEKSERGFYGGMIGYIGFDGSINKAILIRSFFSERNTLHYQAGAGIVAKSKPENELQEISNKLEALRQAMINAQNIHQS
jgi:anthranilate synthase component 1